MTMRVFTLQNALFIFVGLRLVVLIPETFERLRILFILSTIIVHSCFTSCIFAARTLDFAVKFRFVFRYEAVVFRRYVLALLSVGLLRKFEAYLVYLSLIRSKNPRRFSFFQKFRHFTYMLLWFQFAIPSFPARIDDMRSRFSALSLYAVLHSRPQRPRSFWSAPKIAILGADQKERGLWGRECAVLLNANNIRLLTKCDAALLSFRYTSYTP